MSTAPNLTSTDSPEQSGPPWHRLSISCLVILAVIAASWALEVFILRDYAQGRHHLVGPLWIALTYNSGASFSLLQGSAWLPALLSGLVTLAMALVLWRSRSWLLTMGGSLVVGGGLANLRDRFLGGHHGSVADYLWTSFWPTFNLADSAITLGIVLVLLSILLPGLGAERERMVHG